MRILFQAPGAAAATPIDEPQYMLEPDWEGLSGWPAEIHQTPTIYRDGVSLLGLTRTARTFNIPFTVFGSTHQDVWENIQALQTLLNPYNGVGVLYFEQDRVVTVNDVDYKLTYFCHCICQDIAVPSGEARLLGSGAFQQIDLTFFAPDPTWYRFSPPTGYVELETYAYSAITLPITLPLTPPMPAGVVTATNSGQLATPVRMVISGRSRNPTITNTTTGETFAIEWELEESQTFEVTTTPGSLSAMVVDWTNPGQPTYANALPVIDQASTWLHLRPGANRLVYQDDGTSPTEGARPKLTVRYYHRYLGPGV